MKNNIFLTLIIALIAMQNLKAQQRIVVQNGNSVSLYTKLDSAIVHSDNGDTIYIPKGFYSVSQAINKELHIIGNGINPDSSSSYITNINGGFHFEEAGSNSSITGMQISGGLSSSINGNDILIHRCTFNGLTLNVGSSNWIFDENVIYGFLSSSSTPGASNCLFTNNIVEGYFINNYGSGIGFTECIFRNNIFYNNSSCYYGACYHAIQSSNSIIENNIFLGSLYNGLYLINAPNSEINNNLFVADWTLPTNCMGSNNIVNQPIESIFITLPGSGFSFSNNYYLLDDCPGVNAGTDGTDIGIYGSFSPWKDGSFPINPRIISKSISTATNPNGNIFINVSVKAQNN